MTLGCKYVTLILMVEKHVTMATTHINNLLLIIKSINNDTCIFLHRSTMGEG